VQTAAAAPKMFWDQAEQRMVEYHVDREGFYFIQTGEAAIKREDIAYTGPHGPNTVIVNTKERRLYYVYGKGRAMKYGVGVGREGFRWQGQHHITRKAEWPGWTPPPQMIE